MNPSEASPISPGEQSPTPKPKRKYTLTPQALAVKRAGLVEANVVLKEIGCVITHQRRAASRANLAKGPAADNAQGGQACG